MEEESSSPPAKRRRHGESPSFRSSSTSFWFDDGDIVLEVEHHRFKIHRTHLHCSDIFSDMLEIPQPDVIDSVDGCPLVQLSDSARDWLVTLQWMYEPMSFHHPVPFVLIVGALRIATKYEIGALREWTVDNLRVRWPSDLEQMDTTSLSCAAEAIAVAHECDVPDILPAAFYALSLQRWGYNADGGHSHLVLSPADLRRLIVGRERLHDVCARILQDPLLSRPGGVPFDSCPHCREPLQRYWRRKVVADPQSPFECWLLRDLYLMATQRDELFEAALCAPCLAWHKEVAWTRFQGLKISIPRFFCL